MSGATKRRNYIKIAIILILTVIVLSLFGRVGFNLINSKLQENAATTTLQKFIGNNLQTGQYPLEFNTTNLKTVTPTFTTRWKLNNITYIGSVQYNKINGNERKLVISVDVHANVNRTVITRIPNALFIDIKDGWRCIQTNTTEICESFWIEGTTKKGIAVISIPNRTIVQLCEIPKGSEIYSQDTCTIFR